ncbi:MAG: GH116 family glycosyl-hydrolase, partial [Verrucomicrobiae bacterium]|nr:GH116 family glycosyl-hydrolase [Verrucomicrobiae bacterium]
MAGALLVQRLNAEFAMPDRDYEAWRKRLFESDVPRVYLPEKHTDARMHLGGIGTGNIEIGADGQFTTWQLFNTLRDGYVPLYFAVKVGNVSRLLQRAGGPSWPRVQGIEMTGEYPVANLRFFDEGLPIDIELSAFSPFVPLDSRVSSMPLIALVFKLTNKGSEARKVSLAAFGQNPVGYDSRGEIKDNRHPALGFNFNAPLVMDSFAGLVLGAKEGKLPKIGDPVELFVGPNLAELNTPPNDRPDNLHVKVISADGSELSRCANPGRTIIWFEDAPAELPEQILRRARDAVRAGALLVFSGCHQPLLQAHGRFTQGRPITRVPSKPEILFEDFEKGYRNWQVEGSAFGTAPASGTLPNQQPVSGFLGNALVNTYLGGDDTVGKLTSRPFKIERNYIRFLVGGGAHPTTQIRLLVEGKVVRAASGRNNEKLEPFAWDVREFLGREAQIQIVDEQKGGWGHINVDHIVFSDDPVNRGTFELLEELLPIRFSDIRIESDGPDTGVLYVDFALQSDSSERSEADRGRLFVRAVGQGKVILFPGSILGQTDAGFVGPRQRAYEFLCSLLGVQYTRIDGQHPRSMGFGKLAIGVLTGKASRAEDVATAQRPCVTGLVSFDSWNAAWDRFRAEGEFDVLGNAKSSSCTTE